MTLPVAFCFNWFKEAGMLPGDSGSQAHAEGRRAETGKSTLFQAVLVYSYEGIVSIDHNHRVIRFGNRELYSCDSG
jgi:hypothetical protein